MTFLTLGGIDHGLKHTQLTVDIDVDRLNELVKRFLDRANSRTTAMTGEQAWHLLPLP